MSETVTLVAQLNAGWRIVLSPIALAVVDTRYGRSSD